MVSKRIKVLVERKKKKKKKKKKKRRRRRRRRKKLRRFRGHEVPVHKAVESA